MTKMFPDDKPLARQIEAAYLETWARLSPATRRRILAGADDLTPTEVDEFTDMPRSLQSRTLSERLERPADDRWNLELAFADWARREAPTDGRAGQ